MLARPHPVELHTAGDAEGGSESAGDTLTAACSSLEADSRGRKGLQFSDKDEHMYFWFPLLAGLSELTFDPRPDIRYSALEVSASSAQDLLLAPLESPGTSPLSETPQPPCSGCSASCDCEV